MNKTLALAIILMTALTPMAHAKGKKSRNTPAPVITVTPVAPPAAVPKPAVTAPATAYIPNTAGQVRALTVNPLANCTYCAAFAASQGDLATVDAIGGTAP